MLSTEQHLQRIQQKLQQLVKQYALLQKENKKQLDELAKARETITLQNKNMEAIKQKMGIMQLNTAQFSPIDKKEFEKKISAYIKEIDRCIALLGV